MNSIWQLANEGLLDLLKNKEKFVLRLLKKFKKEDKYEDYIKLALNTNIENFGKALSKLLK